MSLDFFASSAWVGGTGTIQPTVPAGLVAGHYVIIDLVSKYETATLASQPVDWDDLGTAVNTGRPAGNDNGNLRSRCFGKKWVDGDVMPSFNPINNNVSAVRASAYRSTVSGADFEVASVLVADNTPGTPLTSGSVPLDLKAGDRLHLSAHVNGDLPTLAGNPAVTATGAVVTSINPNGSGSTTSGTDMRFGGATANVSSGAASTIETPWTLSGTTTNATGTVHIVRLREVLPDAVLVASYAFSEGSGTTAAPTDGSASLTGVPAWAPGKHDGGMLVQDQPGAQTDPFVINGPFTIMADIYCTGRGTWSYNMFFHQSGGSWTVQGLTDGKIEFYPYVAPPAQILALNTWYNIAITADGTTCKLYIDGALAASAPGISLSGTDPIILGSQGASYLGQMRYDNARFFTGAAPDAQIASLAGTPVGGGGPPPVTAFSGWGIPI